MNDKTTRREALSIVGMYRYALLKNERNEWAPEADRRKKEEGGGGRRVLKDRTSMVMSEQAKCGPGKYPRRAKCMGKGGYANKGGEAGEGYTMCRLSEREDLVCHRGDIHFDGGEGQGGKHTLIPKRPSIHPCLLYQQSQGVSYTKEWRQSSVVVRWAAIFESQRQARR